MMQKAATRRCKIQMNNPKMGMSNGLVKHTRLRTRAVLASGLERKTSKPMTLQSTATLLPRRPQPKTVVAAGKEIEVTIDKPLGVQLGNAKKANGGCVVKVQVH